MNEMRCCSVDEVICGLEQYFCNCHVIALVLPRVHLATLQADRYNRFNNRRRLRSLPVNDEFSLIRQWTNPYQSAALQKSLGVVVGIGDDAAVVELKNGFQLVLSSDTMVQDIHFNQRTMGMSDVGFKA